ncbi:hypothetical protein CON45_29300 [Priestia megaterium]|uniref:hypothetical protein n=1 Tax=Priestia megaterium TaxID=1404 RepID=UPI000BEDA38E|nr:hypothetical protein [Priestia megaterium]PEA35578.1 hypothetical protein CON45_29300 [Priestia megaterium]
MFNFLLGVAADQSNSQAVTEQKFTELENGIYERMQDVQDMTHTIQSDQITFLNDQLSNFYTIIGIAVAILTVLGTWAINSIRKANNKAEEHMNKAEEHMHLATNMMEKAEGLSREAEEKIRTLQEEQENLRKLLNSKDLDTKLNTLEKTVEVTSRLEKQMSTTNELHMAKNLLLKAQEIYTDKSIEKFWEVDSQGAEERKNNLAKIDNLNFLVTQMLNQINHIPEQYNESKLFRQLDRLVKEAQKVNTEATETYYKYILPQLDRVWEE